MLEEVLAIARVVFRCWKTIPMECYDVDFSLALGKSSISQL